VWNSDREAATLSFFAGDVTAQQMKPVIPQLKNLNLHMMEQHQEFLLLE
jgi:hypothetical protein